MSRRNPPPTPTLFDLLPALETCDPLPVPETCEPVPAPETCEPLPALESIELLPAQRTAYSLARVHRRSPQPVPELQPPTPLPSARPAPGDQRSSPVRGRSTRKRWTRATVGVVALLLLTLILATTSDLTSTNSATPGGPVATSRTAPVRATPVAPVSAPVSAAPASLPGLHQVVRDGDLAFVVNSVQCGVTAVGTEPLVQTADSGSQWCLAAMTVSNAGGAQQAFFATYQTAIDGAGRRYPADTSAFFSMPNDGQLEDAQISPGASITVMVPFSLPTADSMQRVELSTAASGHGVVVNVL